MLFGTDASGQKVFIPRFLSSMKPPMGIDSIKGCLHLVAQLPFAKDSHAFMAAVDIWCDVNQIWDMVAGENDLLRVAAYHGMR